MPFANIKGININYKVTGQGEPLVMIMGLGTDQVGWMSQVPFFKKYYQVVTFDNRGVGKSDKPAGPYTTEMMADDTIGLMDSLGIKKANILGVSMGGMIAQEIAINYPERVLKLVLGCTYACDDGAMSGQTPASVQALDAGRRGKIGPMLSLTLNKKVYQFIFSILMKIRGIRRGAEDIAGFTAQAAACSTHNTLERLSSIKSPTLVIVGTKDRLLKSTSSKVMAERIPGARLVQLDGGSHGFSIEMKDAFNNAVLNFLTNS
jgi:3-oxoadipate enol-lactonase